MQTTIYSIQPHFQTSRNPEVDWQQEEIDELKKKNLRLERELHAVRNVYWDLRQKNEELENNLIELRQKN